MTQSNTVPYNGVADETSDNEELSTTEIFEILSNKRRQLVLQYLFEECQDDSVLMHQIVDYVAERENGVSIDELEPKKRKCVYTALRQSHLPKMASYGVITYNTQRGEVELVDDIDEIRYYLDSESQKGGVRDRSESGTSEELHDINQSEVTDGEDDTHDENRCPDWVREQQFWEDGESHGESRNGDSVADGGVETLGGVVDASSSGWKSSESGSLRFGNASESADHNGHYSIDPYGSERRGTPQAFDSRMKYLGYGVCLLGVAQAIDVIHRIRSK